jgi:hypothetical protein
MASAAAAVAAAAGDEKQQEVKVNAEAMVFRSRHGTVARGVELLFRNQFSAAEKYLLTVKTDDDARASLLYGMIFVENVSDE